MDYDIIKMQVLDFVQHHNDGATPLVDLICEFCFRNNLPEELVGDAISECDELINIIKWNMNTNQHSLLEDF